MRSRSKYFRVDGKVLALTNLEKVLFPESGFKKRDLLRYYQRIAPVVLPYLRDRPFTLYRFPNGVSEPGFFEKECPSHRPSWVQTGHLKTTRHCLINDAPSLIWAANLGAIELHTVLGTIRDIDCPTSVVFDLDPGEGAGIQECIDVAFYVKELLHHSGLEAFAKMSGKKGLHLHVPLNTRTNFAATKSFARGVAESVERSVPDLVVSKMAKALRSGKVFIDWSQNDVFKSTATVYSLRINSFPSVSIPVTWGELRQAIKKPGFADSLLRISPEDAVARIEKRGDLFRPLLELRQELVTGQIRRSRRAA